MGGRYNWLFLVPDLFMFAAGISGFLGFAGFTAYALVPAWQFAQHRWLRRTVATTLLGGVVGALMLVVPAMTIPALPFELLHAVLCGLALLGLLLARYLTAKAFNERTSSSPAPDG